MKRKENKLINQIPVPVVGMFSSHPSKFKLSPKPTRVGIRESTNGVVICSNEDILDLKRLYFKGWLLSR